jgi:hypothetical protein
MFIKSRTFKKNVLLHKHTELNNNSSQNRASVANTYFSFSPNTSLTLKLHYLFNGQLSISSNAPLQIVTQMTGTYNSSY